MWQEREVPHADTTDENGEFSGVYWFNTTSDWSFFFADRCKKRVRELTVVVDHPNYRAARVVVEAKSLVPVSEGRLLFEVAVPTFALEERDQ